MKYCPYCGEELCDDKAPFCAECGKPIPERKPQAERKTEADPGPTIEPDQTQSEQVEEQDQERVFSPEDGHEEHFPDCYDGYYDDVIPDDHGNIRTTVDKQLIKKIAVLGISVILIIGACVAIMYIL